MPAKSSTVAADAPKPKPKQVRKPAPIRAEEILETACRTFVRDGYAAFSVRQVALDAGVRLGTLQYYYPTRERLLAATIERSLEVWTVGFQGVLEADAPAAARIRTLLNLNLDYALSPEATPLLLELFAMSQHEPFARQILHARYLQYRMMIVSLFKEVRPDLTDDRAMALATLMTSQMEGVMVFTAPDDPARLPPAALREGLDVFVDTFLALLEAGR